MKRKIKNSKKGFTLVEMLTVILILAILALIAIPSVLNIIKGAKKETDQKSIELYAKAIKIAVTSTQINGKAPIRIEDLNMEDFYEGNVTCDITEIYKDGSVFLKECTVNGEKIDYTYGTKLYRDGTPVYFNVDTGTTCQENEAVSEAGTKSGCMKFYAFNDKKTSSTLNLILDHNTTDHVAWNSNIEWANDEEQGPLTLLSQLHIDTDSWNGTEIPTNYNYTNTLETGYSYTIDYSGYKARLISADEIAQITETDEWDSGMYYLDSKTYFVSDTCNSENTTGCNFGWLYDRTGIACTTYGCSNNDVGGSGYWTSSAHLTSSTWFVNNMAQVDWGLPNDLYFGVRPVIEVSKSKLRS